jgi:hypothetical protein
MEGGDEYVERKGKFIHDHPGRLMDRENLKRFEVTKCSINVVIKRKSMLIYEAEAMPILMFYLTNFMELSPFSEAASCAAT